MSESVIPQQRTDEVKKPKRVITRTLVLIERDEAITRPWWKGKTEGEIIGEIKGQPLEDMIQEFTDDVIGTKAEDLFIVRTVKIVDPN